MKVRSTKYADIMLSWGGGFWKFKNYECDMPEDIARSLAGKCPEYVVVENVAPSPKGPTLQAAPDIKMEQLRTILNPERPAIKLSIVLLTYNALSYTQKCIESIRSHTHCTFELNVIDDGSTDGTVEWLNENKDKFTHLTINKKNLGIPKNRNLGIEQSTGEYVLFLDNDTEVSEGWHEQLLDTFNAMPNVGVVGKQGNNVPCLSPLMFDNFVNQAKCLGKYEVDVVPGYCFCFPRKLVDAIGPIENRIGAFWHDDLEFCVRAKAAGYKIVANTEIPIVHYEHKSVRDNGEKVSDDEAKKKYRFFYEKASYINKLMRSDNVVTINRESDRVSNRAYDVLANAVTDTFRKMGLVVLRKKEIPFGLPALDFCKGFSMNYNGNSFIIIHQENDRCPRNWDDYFNRIDYMFCVSPHVYNLLLEHGVDKKKLINTSPNGVDPKFFNTDVKAQPNDKFTFLTVGAAQERKGTDILVKAFSEEFTDKDNVRLVIKSYNYGWPEWMNMIMKTVGSHADIQFIHENWDITKLSQLYRSVAVNGAYVAPFRAEAFGLPIFEALASGCRVGVTNWGGSKYLLKNYANRYKGMITYFDYELTPSLFHNNHLERFYDEDETPLWATPNIEDVKKYMRTMYETRYDATIAKKLSKAVISDYSYENRCKKLFNEMSKYAKGPDAGF